MLLRQTVQFVSKISQMSNFPADPEVAQIGCPARQNEALCEMVLESAAFAFHMCVRTSGIIRGSASRVFLSR
jgi:hypothetical protein